ARTDRAPDRVASLSAGRERADDVRPPPGPLQHAALATRWDCATRSHDGPGPRGGAAWGWPEHAVRPRTHRTRAACWRTGRPALPGLARTRRARARPAWDVAPCRGRRARTARPVRSRQCLPAPPEARSLQ